MAKAILATALTVARPTNALTIWVDAGVLMRERMPVHTRSCFLVLVPAAAPYVFEMGYGFEVIWIHAGSRFAKVV